MCSIPGLPAPGSEVPVLITRVNLNPDCGLVELWVNMDIGRKHIYDQLREEIQVPTRKFCGSEGKPGDLCLVFICDSWHRARIVSIQRETYSVFLVDQGQSHFVTSDALAWGNIDSFLLPPEIESCVLANVLCLEKSWPERASKFLTSLPGRRFEGLVQQVLMPDRTILLDIPLVSRHLYKSGAARKVPADEFKRLVVTRFRSPEGGAPEMEEQNLNSQLEKQGQYFYLELLTDSFETVIITEVNNPNSFYCKLLIFSKAVQMLSELIHKHYEESCDSGEDKPQSCGDPCAAKGINGRWHRSVLKHNMTSDGAVEVLHVDEGKTEVVPVGDIRPLNGKFLKMPVVTYLCSLDGVKDVGWPADQTDYLKSLLLNQTVVVRFENHSEPHDVYYVTVYDANNSCINDSFIEKTGFVPPLKTERDADVGSGTAVSSLLCSLEEQDMDSRNNEETSPSTKNVHIREALEHSEPLTRKDGRLSGGLTYSCSTHNLEVSVKEKVWVTSAENVHHFYCQLERNSLLLSEVVENIKQLIDKPQSSYPPLDLNGICCARYTDGQWYRGEVVESSPGLTVHFVDYGDTLPVTQSDIRPFPAEACVARSVPALAVPLGLFDVPEEVPKEVNRWFVDHAVDHSFTILVVAKGAKGKLIVEMFDGSLNVNVKVRERILKMSQQKASERDEQTDRHNEVFSKNGLELTEITEHDQMCEELKSTVSAKEHEGQTQPRSDVLLKDNGTEITQPSLSSYPERNVFKRPNLPQDEAEQAYASVIVGPHFFWCQYADTEDLNKLSMLAQEASEDATFPKTLGPGSPCLAVFTVDNLWYRAQVVQRSGDDLQVLFVDYGNECNVDVKDVRSLPQNLLDVAPQAFLCSLNGFDGSKGSWDDQVYDDFYKLLVDKPLRVAVCNVEDHCELAVPQYLVNIECDNVPINVLMQKYWNMFSTEPAKSEVAQTEASFQDGQIESNVMFLDVSTQKVSSYLKPEVYKNDTVEAYASVIVGPHFFWCQYADTENLNKLSMLAQEASEDTMFPKTLGPGSPCLAVFTVDNLWYRAQVVQRSGDDLQVLFVDYGNEYNVDVKDVRSLPQNLLDVAPQAFLCFLNGFDDSKGSWDDQVYDDFYKLLVDKPLRVAVCNVEDHCELAVPQYLVNIECEGLVVNTLMEKYWKGLDTNDTSVEGSESVDKDETMNVGV